jgi:hypothetical protein
MQFRGAFLFCVTILQTILKMSVICIQIEVKVVFFKSHRLLGNIVDFILRFVWKIDSQKYARTPAPSNQDPIKMDAAVTFFPYSSV